MGLLTWLRGDPPDVAEHHDSTLASLIVATELQQLSRANSLALAVAAIFRARQMNADTLAALPLKAGESLVPAPNSTQSMQEFVAEVVLSLQDNGDAYIRVTGTGYRVIPYEPMIVTWSRARTINRSRVYTFDNQLMRTTGLATNLVVISINRTPWDLTGTGPLESGRIQGIIAEQAYSQEYYENNGQPTGILSTPGVLTSDEAKLLKESWVNARTVRTPAVLSGGMEWSGESFSPNDSQWVEAHMAGVGDTATLFGVPGSLINYNQPGSSLTYENVESVYQGYWRQTLEPTYASRIEQAVQQITGNVVKFDPSQLFLASIQDRSQAASVLANSGYDLADITRAVGLPPMDAAPIEESADVAPVQG